MQLLCIKNFYRLTDFQFYLIRCILILIIYIHIYVEREGGGHGRMLLSEEMDSQVQNLNEAVFISHSANTFEKDMYPTILAPAMSTRCIR